MVSYVPQDGKARREVNGTGNGMLLPVLVLAAGTAIPPGLRLGLSAGLRGGARASRA